MNDTIITQSPISSETRRRSPISAVVGPPQRRPIVLVLGMHRSGTSLCSHILSVLGVDMADKIPGPGATSPQPDNPRGHWERWEIVEFHDRILSLFNRGYFTPFHDLPLPIAWWADPRVFRIRREIIKFLQERMGEGLFGFKDPRTVRMMPIWHQILDELVLEPKIVFCLRNPAQVSRSLVARDGLDADDAEYRWFSYIADFFRYTSGHNICTIKYETWFDDPSSNLQKLLSFLDLRWNQTEFDLDLTISDIVDRGLRHDDLNYREPAQPLVRSLYKLAICDDREAAAREQIQLIVSQFIGFQQLYRPLQRALENAVAVAASLPQIEQDAAALRAALSKRDGLVESANSRAISAEGALAAAVAQSEALRAHIGVIERERDGLVEAANSRAVSAEGALATAVAQSEALRAHIGVIERERDDLADVIKTVRAELEVTQAELALCGESLLLGKHELAAAEERSRSAITSLQNELAVSRDVGRAALLALRSEAGRLPAEPPDAGWLTSLLRLLGLRATVSLQSPG